MALHLLLDVDVNVVFAKTCDSSVAELFLMEVVYSDFLSHSVICPLSRVWCTCTLIRGAAARLQ
jgi:hypothetical protein